ncbi:MAG: hypothetical protein HKN09_08535 [Saprospiraceae bacterium]|nr:hypothetical protein [Saprospiraceae bacterium]
MKGFKKATALCLMATFGLILSMSSCKTGEGCANQEKYSVKTDKDGNLSTKGGKSNLFSKKNRKKR